MTDMDAAERDTTNNSPISAGDRALRFADSGWRAIFRKYPTFYRSIVELIRQTEDDAHEKGRQAGLEEAAEICQRSAQRHADAANSLGDANKNLSANFEGHRAEEAHLLEEAIRALKDKPEGGR